MKKRILILDDNEMVLGLLHYQLKKEYNVSLVKTTNEALELLENQNLPDLIITDLYLANEESTGFIRTIKAAFPSIPVIVLSGEEKSEKRIECLKLGAEDYILKPFHPEELRLRIEKSLKEKEAEEKAVKVASNHSLNLEYPKPKMSFRKRFFDVTLSGLALLALSPVLLLVAILIRLDSKGPIFYLSKRVGAGYRVFDLYKFRTMRVNADKELNKLSHLNMYEQKQVRKTVEADAQELIYDGGWMSEAQLRLEKASSSAFLKFQNDPRITRLGNFLRNTSLDELPQLINILKGDMSIVGNRPLPLYEAEKLTKDESAARFLAPAGLTGLWQVTKRGKGDLSAAERVWLDNQYAFRHNWQMDLSLILKTFPALFQTENQ